jgi:formamidopyrimidine-DNA glycosylase
MPELCEVQIMTDNLQKWMVGKTISTTEVVDERLSRVSSISMERVESVYRRAKYSVIQLKSQSIILHYRMTGQVVKESVDNPARFVRVRWTLDTGEQIAFVDPRKFGTIDIILNDEVDDWWVKKGLGAEIWPMNRDGVWWSTVMKGVKLPIKVALLKQDRIVGIGNILASEFCFASSISPFVATNTLTMDQWELFSTVSRERIVAILKEEQSEKIGFLHEGAKNPSAFKVYGREGEPCIRCDTQITKCQQSGRATYFCALCQSVQ